MDQSSYQENTVYTVKDAARILHRHPNTIRRLCRCGRIASNCERGGYLIGGTAIRAYVEGRLVVNQNG